jgi:hypothetical protein
MDIREIVWRSMDGIDLAQYSEHGNGILGSINCGAVFELPQNWWLLKKGSAP